MASNKIILIFMICLLSVFSLITRRVWAKVDIITFNTGLAHRFVPYAEERKKYLASNLIREEADILCLQEIWKEEDRRDIIEEVKGRYPYHHFVEANQEFSKNKPACTILDLIGPKKFGSCLLRQCITKKGDEFTSCVINKCGVALNDLKTNNNQCAQALISQVGKNLLSGLIVVLNPFQRAGLMAYEGSAGLLILSKAPFIETDHLELKQYSTSNRRAALYVKTIINRQILNFTCTHLTANLSKTIPYTGSNNSWMEENLIQIKELLSFSSKKKSNGEKEIIAGDINCGPAGKSDQGNEVMAEWESNCNYFLTEGFVDPWPSHECTYCLDNPLVPQNESSVFIDHVFIKGQHGGNKINSKMIFKDLLPIGVPLSDHFGLKISL